MPVVLGDNLTLEDNKLSAVYKELYTKLNKAYAWTHTTESSSNCNVGIITNNSKEISSIKSYNSLPNVYAHRGYDGNSSYNIIIDGTYFQGTSLTEKSNHNYKEVQQNILIDYDGHTYNLNGNIINNGLLINHLSRTGYANIGITKDGKLYYDINTTNPKQIGNLDTWSKISAEYEYRAVAIADGKLYGSNDIRTSQTLLSSSILNFCDCINDDYNVFGLTSDGKLYYFYITSSNSSLRIENVKKIFPVSSYCAVYGMTNDNKLFFAQDNSGINFISNPQHLDFDSICGTKTYAYGVANNNLYFIDKTNSSIELINDEMNFIDIDGTGTDSNYIFFVRLGEYITSETIRYTTKTSQLNKPLYKNLDLETDEIIAEKISSDEIISSNFGNVYIRTPMRDKSFNKTPSETLNETLTVADMLIATNPIN